MRKLREALRLKHETEVNAREIARSCKISPTTLYGYLDRFEQSGMSWPLPAEWGEAELEAKLFGQSTPTRAKEAPLPDMSQMHQELSKKGVTLQLLWEEYRQDYPQGYGRSQFCAYYRRWAKNVDPSMRQIYKVGEKMFVDWAGLTVPVGDGTAHVFVAAQGASDYTYAEAFANTQLPSWIEAHVRAYEFMGGVAEITVPDNDRSAVLRACRYDPEENPTYRRMAEHYGTVIIPTRPRAPRDKAKVENAVQNVERWVLAPLRHQSFFTITELNNAMRPLLKKLNDKPLQQLPGSRASLFEELDKPALKPLPSTRYELSTWSKAKVNIDYHVAVDGHFYSVPYGLVGRRVEIELTARTVEILYRGKRVALHPRSREQGRATTLSEHRPKSHQRHAEWSPARLVQWAEREVGPQCAAVVKTILETKPHPEQGYRSCLGLMRLARGYGRDRLEAAAQRALALDACSYRSIASMLKSGLDRQPLSEASSPPNPPAVSHRNIRGRQYYRRSQNSPESDHVA